MSNNPLEDDPKRDARIRERAYHLWKADGEPHGRDAEYWERARELIGMAESAGAGQISPAADAAHRINGQIVDEAALEENLGEFPGRQTDQGDRPAAPGRKTAPAARKPAPPAVMKPAAPKAAIKPTPAKTAAKPAAQKAAVTPAAPKTAPKPAAAKLQPVPVVVVPAKAKRATKKA
jgi:hypothetical protein